ncbi:3-deoxy-7-phosphoheptulonate synthase [Actinopolyspora erythraea]|uniref:Phospho-2-dehydro-3-deoxyheptonate aldolase n=1 Tax=Actinopolyspora erythraea TaxID=414996 RepID=A0A223RT15_9ACTN|nr:3-deoxy-7-phosphoheptulonate synthase [Actinopolyspora erythraea]ASU79012.1 3-deoxy-7-phosphoheptulonate synthase [Actinopolyspora erythraea]
MTIVEDSDDDIGVELTSADEGVLSRAVTPPRDLLRQLPRGPQLEEAVWRHRDAVRDVLRGVDDRLVVFVGPCSVHDVDAGLAYAKSLRVLADELDQDLLVVMRLYLEKPRTAVGWPGLLTDPGLDGGGDAETGLWRARGLMLEVAELGLPIATEWLNPAAPAYLADLVSWGAIGARTVESQPHRQVASGLPMPIGMKNGSTGSVQAAVDAVRSAAAPHTYLGTGSDGRLAVLRSHGNPDCNVVLRGGPEQPNYGEADVRAAVDRLDAHGLSTGLVIDASHGNSGKDHERQTVVAREIAARIAGGTGEIRGVMLESFLVAGRQGERSRDPVFGQSVTDACLGWETTVELLHVLAESVRARRGLSA